MTNEGELPAVFFTGSLAGVTEERVV